MMQTKAAAPTHRCFFCGTASDQSEQVAVHAGWSFQPVRDIAACPSHSTDGHDTNLARVAHAFGWKVEDLYRRALPINHDVISEMAAMRAEVAELREQLSGTAA